MFYSLSILVNFVWFLNTFSEQMLENSRTENSSDILWIGIRTECPCNRRPERTRNVRSHAIPTHVLNAVSWVFTLEPKMRRMSRKMQMKKRQTKKIKTTKKKIWRKINKKILFILVIVIWLYSLALALACVWNIS